MHNKTVPWLRSNLTVTSFNHLPDPQQVLEFLMKSDQWLSWVFVKLIEEGGGPSGSISKDIQGMCSV